MAKVTVTEKWVKEQFAAGKTVKQVIDLINEGITKGGVSAERFKNQLKAWGIDAQKKPLPSIVEFSSEGTGIQKDLGVPETKEAVIA